VTTLDLFVNLAYDLDRDAGRRNVADLVTVARRAEDIGFAGVFLAEHPSAVGGIVPSALQLAVYLGACTERIQIGTAGVIGMLRHPRLLAEEVAQAALLLGTERLEVGAVKGFQAEVFHAVDRSLPTNDEFDAFLLDVRIHLDRLGVSVGLWTAGTAAARAGLPMLANPYSRGSRDVVATDLSAYRAALGTSSEVFAHLLVYVDECPRRADEVGLVAIDAYLDAHGNGESARDLVDAGLAIVGTPDVVAQELRWFTERGVTRVGVNALVGFLGVDAIGRSLDLLAGSRHPDLTPTHYQPRRNP
jgi:alkanesulfonate monooxygenase SsuD/methylene tetrahydromethanopterin reductase-like flavin-dependent oxidoreductase (luciferase family)